MKLVILDDYFPSIFTAFRIVEYNYYLKTFPESQVFSTSGEFNKCITGYKEYFPQYVSQIKPFSDIYDKKIDVDIFYTVFINNIYNFLPYIEKVNKPFIFCLHPGGGLQYNDGLSDMKLRTVFSSKLFKKVIVSQKSIYNYLINNNFTTMDKVEFIYAGPVITPMESKEKMLFKKNKDTFDICFVAHKYMPGGLDKGYDLFIEICNRISQDSDIRFHVVGGCTENDADISKIRDKIKFYGIQPHNFFPQFYSNMDIIVSPNRNNVLYNGAFDGFPTGCCVHAGLNGVAVFCTDPLNENIYFEDNKDICIITHDVKEIVSKIIHYKNNLDELYSISRRTKISFEKVFDLENQMSQRMKLLWQIVHEG